MHDLPTGTVTLLFTDMEGSTHLLQRVGDRYVGLLAECRQLLRTAFQHCSGYEIDTQGDSFFVVFARATDAVLAAVEMQRALATHPWPEGAEVRVRIGLHTGEPQCSSEGYVGLAVHLAARIMSAGHGGQVLLSQTTRDLVEHALPEGVHLQDLGAHRLKDLQQPCHLFQLVIPGLQVDFPLLKTLDSHPHNLPLQPTPFIGREKEVDALQQILLREGSRLVTLTGPGGVGKTRLALQVTAELAEHFPDGSWFVSLAPISDPTLVIPTISQTLGLREARDQTPLEHLKSALQEKQTLLLLDNFEQVVSAALSVADLLAGCPQLKVLVTSREGLHVRAEREFPVPALALPDPKHLPDLLSLSQYAAVALFIERAQAVKPDFQVTNTTAPAVAEICVRLDGLPLAIELAAARIRLFPPQALLIRLGQRLPLLASSTRDVPARQQTLRKTIQWSYDLLTPDEQRLFRRLSVFVGGCTWQAIEAVAADLADEMTSVLDAVSSLVDKNLLQQTEQEGENTRFMMLETIREYGLEELSKSGEMEKARQAHAAYYLALAEEAAQGFTSTQQAGWWERLEREHDNLRATLAWSLEPAQAGSDLHMAMQLGDALCDFWEVRGFLSEGGTFYEQALSCCDCVAASVRAKILSATADFASGQGDYQRAQELYQESLTLYRELGENRGVGWNLKGLAWIAWYTRNNYAEARSLLEECLALSRERGDKETIAWLLENVADVACYQGDYSKGLALYEESLTMFREQGNKLGIAVCVEFSAAWLLFAQGDQVTLQARLEECLTLSRELGYKHGIAMYFFISGWLALMQGDAITAHALTKQSLLHFQEIENPANVIMSRALLGRIATHQGDLVTARAFYEESLALARKLNGYWQCAHCLEGLASVAAAQGEKAWAVRLWGRAESLRESMGGHISPLERLDDEPAIAAVRTQLGEQTFAAAWAEGRAMTLDQVLGVPEPAGLSTPTIEEQRETTTAKPLPIYPDGLTAREVELLRFVAKGLTDAQIAGHKQEHEHMKGHTKPRS